MAALAAAFGGKAATGLPREVENPVAGRCGHLNQVRSPRFQISVHLPSRIRAFARRSFASGSRDIFIATRQHLRAELQVSRAALAGAERQTDEVCGRLAGARLAAEAVERLMTERTAAARAEADRQAQHVLDDIARGLRK